MKLKNIDNVLICLILAAFSLAYLLTFPTGWLISDEYSYLNQALAICNGESNLSYVDAVTGESIAYKSTRYPLGNSFWIALWMKILGLKLVHLVNLLIVVFSTFLMYKVLKKESLNVLGVLLIFLFPPLAFFSNTFMSSLPSLLLVSIYFYLLFHRKESAGKWMLLCTLASFSFWFRETNIVLLGSICLLHFFQERKWFWHYASGTILGLSPRILSSYYFYDDPFHYVLAESFSIGNIPSNALVYAIILLCFMPLGLYFLYNYKGRYKFSILSATILFIGMYLMYSFNATAYSGFRKGVILMGRFMIPLIPIFVISIAWYFRDSNFSKGLKYAITTFSIFIIFGFQYLIMEESSLHQKISDHIYENYSKEMILYDQSRTTNIVRYINPFQGEITNSADISRLSDKQYMDKILNKFGEAIIIQTLNTANDLKTTNSSKIENIIQNEGKSYLSEELEKVQIKPSLYLQIIKIQNRDEQIQ